MGLIAIVDSSERFVAEAGLLLAAEPGVEVRHVLPTQVADADGAAVLVVGPSEDPALGVALAQDGESTDSDAGVVIVTDGVSTPLMREALRAGVRDVVDSNVAASEIGESILRVYRRVEAERASAGLTGPDVVEGGRIVTVFSMKGGVGKTVLATNLAAALADRFEMSVAIVDLDLQFGDVGIMLGLTPERTISDAVARGDRLDADYLRGCMTPHPSGMAALLAPTRPEEAENITTGRLARILDLLRTMYDVVVIDTAATFDEVVLTALDRSESVFGVTMMDVASIKNTRISLQKLSQLGYDGGLVKLVLNRADSKVWLQPGEVEKAIGAEVFAKIPSDRVVPRSVNKGTPVVLDEPRSDVSKAMVDIARGIAKSAEEAVSHVA